MTDPPATAENRVPFRRLIFMPWRWKRWAWAVIIPLAISGYLFSAMPVMYLLSTRAVPSAVFSLGNNFYEPAWWCQRDSQIVNAIYLRQWDFMDRALRP